MLLINPFVQIKFLQILKCNDLSFIRRYSYFHFAMFFSEFIFILQLEIYSIRVPGISEKSDLHIEIKNLISICSMKYLKNITCTCTCVFQVLNNLSLP